MTNVSPVNTAAKYGAMGGLATFVLCVLIWLMGKNPLGSWSIIGWAIPIVFTALTLRDYRNKDLNGYITYWRGVGAGMLVSLFSGFLFAALLYAFITFIARGIPQMQIDEFYANMEKVKGFISEENYEKAMQTFEASKDNYTRGNLAISNFELHLIGGFIISLIIAAIYKKNPPLTDTSDITESNLN